MAARDDHPQRGALDGVLVVELGRRTGAAVCGSLLAQLGADVVAAQPSSDRADAQSLSDKWNWPEAALAGKLPCASADEATLRRLCEAADVVITSSDMEPPGSWSAGPGQVVCDITAWGAGAPREAACEWQVQALSGIVATTGPRDGDPLPVPLPLVETLCGMHAAGAVLAALRHARAAGEGQRIDMALYDCAFAAMSSFFSRLLVTGRAVEPVTRLGNQHTLSAPWNVYRARDGWILVCTGSNLQWQRLCDVMGRPELARAPGLLNSEDRVARVGEVDAVVQQWLATQSVADCMDAFARASIPGGPVTPIDGFPREQNLLHRGMVHVRQGAAPLAGSPLRMSRTPGRALAPRVADHDALAGLLASAQRASAQPAQATDGRGSLEGLRVLEIGHYTTAPVAARHLAALGADVVKIEPPEGEAARGWAPMVQGQSVFYTVSNSDKGNVTLDLASAPGRDALRGMLAGADVLLENLKPGTLAKHGFSPEQLAAINPRLVACAISGFGAHSIYAARPAFDTVVQGMSGLMDLIRANGVPYKTGISTADVMGAAMAVVAVLGALHERERSGLGQFIDLSMQDIVAWATQPAWVASRRLPASRLVRCSDGHLLVIGEGRVPDADTMTREQAAGMVRGKGLRCAPVRVPAEVVHASETTARRLHFLVHDERGEWPALAVPLRLLGTPPHVRRPGPRLGADNPVAPPAALQATP